MFVLFYVTGSDSTFLLDFCVKDSDGTISLNCSLIDFYVSGDFMVLSELFSNLIMSSLANLDYFVSKISSCIYIEAYYIDTFYIELF